MKRCVYCLLVLALTLSVLPVMPALAEEGEEVTLTIGKAFNTQGTTFPEGHDAQNYNYYLDYAQQKANVKIEYSRFLAGWNSQKVTLAVASGNMPDVMLVDQTTYNMLLESDMLQSLSQVYETSGKGTLVDEVYSVYPESFQSAKVGDELMALPNAVAQYEHDVLWVGRIGWISWGSRRPALWKNWKKWPGRLSNRTRMATVRPTPLALDSVRRFSRPITAITAPAPLPRSMEPIPECGTKKKMDR